MSDDERLDVELTKWPRLLVAGESISPEQAGEIILRTTSYLTANDRYFVARVCELFGIEVDNTTGMMPDWRSFGAWYQSINGLRLDYLKNSQIMSSWIGGAHGWCHWSGAIGCSNYNIGKWPSAAAVEEEWQLIAAAWPFLDLHCQLVPDEGEAPYAVAEWRVRGGRVMRPADPPPYEPIVTVTEVLDFRAIKALFVGGERGVELARLEEAWSRIRPARALEARQP